MTVQDFELVGRVAVITGAASGIGRATAVTLARAGAAVVLADVDGAGLAETAKLVGDGGGRSLALETDVTDREQVHGLVATAISEFDRIDVMVNVAGVMHRSPVVETTEDDLDRVLTVNFKGAVFGCQAAMAAMAGQGSGSIVNMASTAIDQGGEGLLAYAASKAAVVMLTKVAAREAGPDGIRVNVVAPGYVPTAMTQSEGEEVAGVMLRMMKKVSPLDRVGEPGDIANAVLYLASDASRFVTGQIIRPNGGVTMPW